MRRVFPPASPALTCHPEEVAPKLWRRHREPHPQPELVLEIVLSKNDQA